MLGIGNVVPCLRNAHVHNHALQRVLGAREVFEIVERELEVSIDLVAIVANVLEPLQNEGQIGRKRLYLYDFLGCDLAFALVAVVSVFVVEDFWFEVVVERVFKVVEVLHLNAQTGELLLFLRLVLALLAADDGSLLPVEESLHEVVVRRNRVLYAIQEQISELVHVHLYVNAGIASLDALEGLEELRVEIGFSAVGEMDEDFLELIDEVLFLVVVLGELCFEHL